MAHGAVVYDATANDRHVGLLVADPVTRPHEYGVSCSTTPANLRPVRSWLHPWRVLRRSWWAWSRLTPPPELQERLDAVGVGFSLRLDLRH